MIKEDYVSLEVAKLLKDKGFNEYCFTAYSTEIGDFITVGPIKNSEIDADKDDTHICTAPTHQMAMKWLREVHNIYIEIAFYSRYKPVYYRWSASKNGRVVSDEEIPSKEIECHIEGEYPNLAVFYKNHNEAVESALKYCLENLI